MKTQPKLVIVAVLLVGCASSSTAPDQGSARITPPDEPQKTAPPEPGNAIRYHNYEGEPRVFLTPESRQCVENPMTNVLYQPRALWRFDSDTEAWVAVPVATDAGLRLSCNAMLGIEDILGENLAIGTYAVLADVDGQPERATFSVGKMSCNDVALEPGEGRVPLCIVGESSAEARLVPDPSALNP